MVQPQPDGWQGWYQSVGYAALGLIVAAAFLVLLTLDRENAWYLYVPPILFALLSLERLVQAQRRRSH